MKNINSAVKFCFDLAKFQTELSRRFDARLGGIGFNELVILYHLNNSDNQKIRRIDLAEKVGLTASGVTRLLLPMEKVGLVKKVASQRDARVSYVRIAPGGQTKLKEGLERAEIFCEAMVLPGNLKKVEDVSKLLLELGKNI